METPPFDPFSYRLADRLFAARTVIVSGQIEHNMASRIIAQLLALAAASDDDVTVVIHSQGGHVESGDSIHDVIRSIRPRVRMVGTGWVASAGALIYVAVPREDRFCLPNTRFLLHQPWGGVGGGTPARDIEIEAEEIVKMRERINAILARATGQPIEKIRRDADRNFWLNPEEAVAYGLVGKVVERMEDVR